MAGGGGNRKSDFPALRPQVVCLKGLIQYIADGEKSLAAGDVNAALAKFQSAIKFHPEHAGGYAGRGRVFVVQDKLSEAETDLTRALQLDADSWMALLGRGELRIAQGDHARALEDLNRAVQLAPNESILYRVRSKALGLSGDATAADQDLKTASRLGAEK